MLIATFAFEDHIFRVFCICRQAQYERDLRAQLPNRINLESTWTSVVGFVSDPQNFNQVGQANADGKTAYVAELITNKKSEIPSICNKVFE